MAGLITEWSLFVNCRHTALAARRTPGDVSQDDAHQTGSKRHPGHATTSSPVVGYQILCDSQSQLRIRRAQVTYHSRQRDTTCSAGMSPLQGCWHIGAFACSRIRLMIGVGGRREPIACEWTPSSCGSWPPFPLIAKVAPPPPYAAGPPKSGDAHWKEATIRYIERPRCAQIRPSRSRGRESRWTRSHRGDTSHRKDKVRGHKTACAVATRAPPYRCDRLGSNFGSLAKMFRAVQRSRALRAPGRYPRENRFSPMLTFPFRLVVSLQSSAPLPRPPHDERTSH